jgi:predicted small metal-binding protein
MKRLSCKDVGMNCDFVMEGKDDDEIMRKAREHGAKTHGIQNVSPEMEKDLRKQIKNV